MLCLRKHAVLVQDRAQSEVLHWGQKNSGSPPVYVYTYIICASWNMFAFNILLTIKCSLQPWNIFTADLSGPPYFKEAAIFLGELTSLANGLQNLFSYKSDVGFIPFIIRGHGVTAHIKHNYLETRCLPSHFSLLPILDVKERETIFFSQRKDEHKYKNTKHS